MKLRFLQQRCFLRIRCRNRINVQLRYFCGAKHEGHKVAKAIGSVLGSVKPCPKNLQRLPEEEAEQKVEAVKAKDDTDDSIDPRVIPITISTFLMGTSISCVVPILPILATELGLSSAEYGYVMSVIGIARLLATIPLTCFIDSKGRRPMLVFFPLITACSMFGLGTATTLGALMATRFANGISSAGQMLAAQIYLSDISKSNNRARTMAPNFIAWNAGFILGPVIGGTLAELVNIRFPFFCVGSVIAGISVLNYFRLPETAPSLDNTTSISTQMSVAIQTWKSLIRREEVFTIVLLQSSFWLCMSGIQFCLFPIYCIQTLDFTAAQLGTCYTLNAVTNVALSRSSANASDKFGRKKMIVPACLVSMFGLNLIPFCTSYYEILASVFITSCGNAVLSTNPRAYLIDIVSEKDRSQALAMVSSAGDMGLFCGALMGGAIAQCYGMHVAVPACSSLLGLSVLRFGFKGKNI